MEQAGLEKGEPSSDNGTSTILLPEVAVAIATPILKPAEQQLSAKTLENILEKLKQTSFCIEQTFRTCKALLPKVQPESFSESDLTKGSIHTLQAELVEAKLQNQLLNGKLHNAKDSHLTELTTIQDAEQKHLQRIKDLHKSLQSHKQSATVIANNLQQIKQMALTFKEEFRNAVQQTSTGFAAQIRESNLLTALPTNQQRATELAKLEAFDQWMNKSDLTKEELTTKQMFDKIMSKIGHTFKSLRTELAQAITEKKDLQEKFEQQEKSDTHKWENIMGQNQIEDPTNLTTSTMKNLAPPVSIF